MSDWSTGIALLIGAPIGVGLVLGIEAIVRVIRSAANERAREKRYADEWVRRHRESRQR
jgi:hypothetical protein